MGLLKDRGAGTMIMLYNVMIVCQKGLQVCDTFDLHVCLHWQLLDCHARSALGTASAAYRPTMHTKTYRLRWFEKGVIDPVHGSKVGHV